MGIKEYERNIGYGEDVLKIILEVQFDFLSREEKVKLYTYMTNSEKIPIAHRDICSYSGIQDIDMIM